MSESAETSDFDYICVGICRVDPESGSCLGCGRPPLPGPDPLPEFESPVVAADVSRYPVAAELSLEVQAEAGGAWEHLV